MLVVYENRTLCFRESWEIDYKDFMKSFKISSRKGYWTISVNGVTLVKDIKGSDDFTVEVM